MIRTKTFIVGEGGSTETFQEEVSCKPTHFREEDIIHAAFMLAIGRFAAEYDKRLAEPGCEADLEDVDLDGWSIDGNIPLDFPKVTILKGYTDMVTNFVKRGNDLVAQGYKGPVNYYMRINDGKIEKKRL